jgi:hypothetical protein
VKIFRYEIGEVTEAMYFWSLLFTVDSPLDEWRMTEGFQEERMTRSGLVFKRMVPTTILD